MDPHLLDEWQSALAELTAMNDEIETQQEIADDERYEDQRLIAARNADR